MDNPRSTPPAISGHLSVDLVLLRLDPSTAPPESRRSSRIRSLLPRLSSGEPPHAGQPSTLLLWAFPSLSLFLSLSLISVFSREGWGHGTQSAAHRSRCRKPLRRPRAPPPRSVRWTRRRLLHRLSSGGGQPRVVPVRPPRGLAQPSSPAKAVEHLVFLPYRGSTTLPRPVPPLSPPPPPAPPLFSPSSFRITERSHRIAANGKEQHGRGVESGTQAWSLST